MVRVLNITDRDVHVRRGARLAQGEMLPAPRVTWEDATDLRATPRGGFGSTGT
jgi:dUTPase